MFIYFNFIVIKWWILLILPTSLLFICVFFPLFLQFMNEISHITTPFLNSIHFVVLCNIASVVVEAWWMISFVLYFFFKWHKCISFDFFLQSLLFNGHCYRLNFYSHLVFHSIENITKEINEFECCKTQVLPNNNLFG